MYKSKISRRQFIKTSSASLGGALLTPPFSRFPAPFLRNNKLARKVIVLGMDGMDPRLTQKFMKDGDLPTFKKLAEMGYFGTLQTTLPPQTPVAWSSFITGTNPGGNGIYDFIHRDPATFSPYLSITRSYDADSSFKVGDWKIPLSSGRMESMRRGPSLFSALESHGVDSTVFQIPANFPISTTTSHAISGVGTPDLLGGYGTSTYFTEVSVPDSERYDNVGIVKIFPLNHKVSTTLTGPKNSLRSDESSAKIPFTIHRDPTEKTILIKIQSHQIVLKEGEWSGWIPVSFELMPMFASVAGMVRFFAKEIHPRLKVYCSPINIDPMEPTLPICSPSSYSRELSEAVGRFYTQGFPADSKALSHGFLTDDEYFQQANLVIEENMRAFEYQFERFKEGFFFFYFSSVDQNCHMLWRLMDPSHPLYKSGANEQVKNGVRHFYRKMDEALKLAMTKVDSDTLILALSDHGFTTFLREFNLSTWMVQEGFTALHPRGKDESEGDFYNFVDWEKTKAYALGLNGIYLNLKGRENHGILEPEEAGRVKALLIEKLTRVVDPKTGLKVVAAAYDSLKVYSGPFTELAPDIIVGYADGFRISDESVLGKFPKEIIADRNDAWSADHCIDPHAVPGILLSNRSWAAKSPGLWDMAPTIIDAFGLPVPKEMEGKSIFT